MVGSSKQLGRAWPDPSLLRQNTKASLNAPGKAQHTDHPDRSEQAGSIMLSDHSSGGSTSLATGLWSPGSDVNPGDHSYLSLSFPG